MLAFLFAGLQGTLTAIRDWFRDYKILDGKPANKFGFDNKAADKVYLLTVLNHLDYIGVQVLRFLCAKNFPLMPTARSSLVFMLQDYALKVIAETHTAWANLVKRSVAAGNLSLV